MANWKSVASVDASALAQDFLESGTFVRTKYILCPSFLHSKQVIETVRNSLHIKVGAQDVSRFSGGAYTGEIPAKYLSAAGVTHVLLGHSERRTHHKESNSIVCEKFQQAEDEGITPIVCVGDDNAAASLEEKLYFVRKQMDESVPKRVQSRFFIAYEPTYAIGSNRISRDKIQEMIIFIKDYWKQRKSDTSVEILYGGGVDSLREFYDLWKDEVINGVLLGRASLDPKKLVTMLKAEGFK